MLLILTSYYSYSLVYLERFYLLQRFHLTIFESADFFCYIAFCFGRRVVVSGYMSIHKPGFLRTIQILVVPLRVNVNLKAVTVDELVSRRKVCSHASEKVNLYVCTLQNSSLKVDFYSIVYYMLLKDLKFCTGRICILPCRRISG